MSINDATPTEWDNLRTNHPELDEGVHALLTAVHRYGTEPGPLGNAVLGRATDGLDDLKPYHNIANEELEDVVNSPSHYNSGGVECIQAIEASMEPEAFQGYLKGNTLKYLWRMSYKGKALEDCKKAQWYLNKLISTLEEKIK